IARSTGALPPGRRQLPRRRSSTRRQYDEISAHEKAAAPASRGGWWTGVPIRRRRVPAAQEIDGEERERCEHRQRPEREDRPAHGLGGLQETEPAGNVVPVVHQPRRHHLPREAQEDQEAERANGDAGNVQASRFGGLMPYALILR